MSRFPSTRPCTGRALLFLTLATVVRLLREGLVVRALAWPGLLTALALVGSTTVVALLTRSPQITVPPGHPEVSAALRSAGFTVQESPDPQGDVEAGRSPSAAWPAGQGWALLAGQGSTLGLRAESALRGAIGAPWVIDVPAPPARSVEGGAAVGAMSGMLSVLFALYGVVLGAGTVARDRQGAVLEAEYALPLPFAVHGGARLLAGSLSLAGALAVTLLLLEALVGVPDLARWLWHGTLAGTGGVALGLGAVGAQREGFSGPISRALTAGLGLFALGWALPALGAWLPIASLSALIRGGPGLGPAMAPSLSTTALCALAVRRLARRGVA